MKRRNSNFAGLIGVFTGMCCILLEAMQVFHHIPISGSAIVAGAGLIAHGIALLEKDG